VQTFAIAGNFSAADVARSVGLSITPPTVLAELWNATLAQLAPVLPYLLLVLILILRPTGLMGSRAS